MTDTEDPGVYQVGGSLPFNNPTYIKRRTDDQLLEKLKAGDLCCIINARQMGKSSLLIRTKQHLKQEGYACAVLNLQGIGSSIDREDWYKAIFIELAKNFDLLDIDIDKYWEKLKKTEPSIVSRFINFTRLLFKKITIQKNKIFIFIDEIDQVKGLNFNCYDFFGFIQTYYNNKVTISPDKSLVFSLFGNADPPDLLPKSYNNNYKFNVGQSIYLEGFKETDELEPLTQGLVEKFSDSSYTAEQAIQEVLKWTNGQPFLTQKICYLIQQSTDEITVGQERKWIGEFIQENIIDYWLYSDSPEHFRSIRAQILNEDSCFIRRLELYKKILQKHSVPYKPSEIVHRQLTLSGLVINQQGYLRVFNRIYEHIFDLDWVEQQINNYFPYSVKFNQWIDSGKTDRSQLLIGQEFKKADQWKEGKDLGQEKNNFYFESLKFDSHLRGHIGYLEKYNLDYEFVMRAIWHWTKGDKNLDDKIIKFLYNNRNSIRINRQYKERSVINKTILNSGLEQFLTLDDYHLLMRNNLSNTLEASMFSQEDIQNIIRSFDDFIESQLFVKHPLLIVSAIMDLTNRHPALIQLIIQIIVDHKKQIAPNELTKIIQENLIHDWPRNIGAKHFKEIREAIIKNTTTKPYSLLQQYDKILLNLPQSQPVELKELEKIGLVYKDSEGKFKVHNLIYEKVFNQDWVKKELNGLKPYGAKLTAWLKSDDESKDTNPSLLLAGDELQEAQKWIEEVDDVEQIDHKYIMRSMVYQQLMNSGEL